MGRDVGRLGEKGEKIEQKKIKQRKKTDTNNSTAIARRKGDGGVEEGEGV